MFRDDMKSWRYFRGYNQKSKETEVGSLPKDIFAITRYFFHKNAIYLWIIISFKIPNMFPYSHMSHNYSISSKSNTIDSILKNNLE